MTVKELFDKLETSIKGAGIPFSRFDANISELPLAVLSESEERYIFGDDRITGTVLLFELRYLTRNDLDDNKEVLKQLLLDAGASFGCKVFFSYERRVVVHIFDCEVML